MADQEKTKGIFQKPNGFEKNQMEAKKTDNDNEDDNDKDNEIDNDLLSEEEKEEYTKNWEEQFDEFYAKYPKKVKKQDVKKWFMKNKPSNELFSSMINSLEQFRASADWQKDGGQYIPYPITWLNQKRWEDEGIEQEQTLSNARQYDNLDFLYANNINDN